MSEEQKEELRIIEAETRQGQSIVRGLLDLARPICVEPSEVDLAELATDAVERLKESGKLSGYEVVVSSGSSVPAWGDEARLRQVLRNLLTNAAEATAPAGRIEVEAASESETARLTIRDSGSGIAAEIRPRVFDPFFTTKPQGVGLGLAMSEAASRTTDRGACPPPGQGHAPYRGEAGHPSLRFRRCDRLPIHPRLLEARRRALRCRDPDHTFTPVWSQRRLAEIITAYLVERTERPAD